MFAAPFLSPILCASSKSEEGVYNQVIESRVCVYPIGFPRASICLRPTELSKSSLSLIVNAIRSLPKKPSRTSANRFTLESLLSSSLPSSSSSPPLLYAILLSPHTPLLSFPSTLSFQYCILGDRMSVLTLEST